MFTLTGMMVIIVAYSYLFISSDRHIYILYAVTDCAAACVDGTTYETAACAAGVDRTCSSKLSNVGPD